MARKLLIFLFQAKLVRESNQLSPIRRLSRQQQEQLLAQLSQAAVVMQFATLEHMASQDALWAG